MRPQTNLERRLTSTRDALGREREALHVVAEQLAYLRDVAGEAEIRALVSATPLAQRERQEAAGDLARVEREHADALARVRALVVQQDALLEQLLARGRSRA